MFTRIVPPALVVSLLVGLGSVHAAEPEAPAAEVDAATRLAVGANSDFAVALYHRLAKENDGKNLFFSPYSISSALAMTVEGARGETADQMGTVLCYPPGVLRTGDESIPWNMSLIHSGMASLNERLTGKKDDAKVAAIRARIEEARKELAALKERMKQLEKQQNFQAHFQAHSQERAAAEKLNAALAHVDQYEIRIANALWGEKSYPFRDKYVTTINKHYRTGGLFPVDFITGHEQVRLRINGWIEDQIKDAIPEGMLNEDTRLVLTNAIYFKGEWAETFDVKNTTDEDFTLAAGTTVKTPLMTQHGHKAARYAAFNADGTFFDSPRQMQPGQTKGLYPGPDGFAMVDLPYKGDALSMIVIAPNSADGLAALEEKLSTENLSGWIGQLKRRQTHVYLPKFKLETSYTLGSGGDQASGTLPGMGMTRAFTDPRDPKQGAQFGGMSASEDPAYRLYITKVLHKAFVEVNEEGTEAAAVTVVVGAVATSVQITVPFTPTFRADRPFIYLIRDNATGSVLFLGRMSNPAA